MSVTVCNPHTCGYLRWKSGKDLSSSCRDIRLDMPIFAVSSKKVQLFPRNFWGYWTDLDHICPRCSYNIAIKIFFLPELPYTYPFRNARLPNEVIFANFAQNWLPWQCLLRNWKKRSISIIYKQIPINQWKDCENQSSESWDNWASSDH